MLDQVDGEVFSEKMMFKQSSKEWKEVSPSKGWGQKEQGSQRDGICEGPEARNTSMY